MLQSKRNVTADYIADKYAISVRTVYRDLRALGEIGVPITFENAKGYSILQGYFLPPLLLTSEEANALILVSSLSERFTDRSTKKHIEDALNKIKAVLRSSDKEKANELQSQIRIYNPLARAASTDFLTAIQKAIVDKYMIEINYTNNSGEASRRRVEPIGLTFYTNQWHLIAWCWNRNEYRDFKVDKISELSNTGESFKKRNHYDINEYVKSIL